ncbi:hypothetical protein ES703_18347 [subsurface metagenome]
MKKRRLFQNLILILFLCAGLLLGGSILLRATNISLGVEITEIMYDTPDDLDAGGEWIEIYNNSGGTINITDWATSSDGGTTWRSISQEAGYGSISTIPDGGYAVICEAASTNNFIELYDGDPYPAFSGRLGRASGDLGLAQGGENIRLNDAADGSGTDYQNFDYPDNVANNSMEKSAAADDEDVSGNWSATTHDYGNPGTGPDDPNGSGTASASPTSVDKDSTGNSIDITITGDGVNTLTCISITIPYQWTWTGSAANVTLSGAGFTDTGADKVVTGAGSEGDPWVITIGGVTPAAVTDDDAGTATIDTLTAPSTTGSYEFTVKTAISGGTLTTMRSTQPTVFVSIGAGAVVINEIAWMGTLHDSGHEWIELYNTTASDISIEDWSICGADTAETLNFSAADSGSTTVPANGYLLYAEDSTVFSSGIPVGVNKLYDSTIGLNNTSPGQIILYEAQNGSGPVIDTANQTSDDWFAGLSTGNKPSMERINPGVDGTIASNWADNNEDVMNGKDAGTNDIYGTPGAENSAHFFISEAQTMDSNHNGLIDHYKLTFDEEVLDSSIDGYSLNEIGADVHTIFSVTGHSTVKLAHGSAAPEEDTENDTTVYFQINESASSHTGTRPEINTTSAAVTDDEEKKSLVDVIDAVLTETDGAEPVPTDVSSSEKLDGNKLPAGTVLTITFSEDVTYDAAIDGDFVATFDGSTDAGWPDGATVTYEQGTSDTVTATLNPGTSTASWTTLATFNRDGDDMATEDGIDDGAPGNEAVANASDPSITGLSTNPDASSISPTHATDGTGYISFTTTVSDSDGDICQLKVEYFDGSNWYDPDLYSVAGTGSPDLDNNLEYQITNITNTSPPGNTLTIVWDTKSSNNENGSLDNADTSNVKLRVTPADNYDAGTVKISSDFSVNNLAPDGLDLFDKSSVTSGSITLSWSATTDTNFNHYEIWYGEDYIKVQTRDDTGSPDGATKKEETNTSTTITGLTANTIYYFKIWAIDDYGNEEPEPMITASTSAVDVSKAKSTSEEWGCFIASAAYSGCTDGHRFITDGHRSQIVTLQDFRDNYLLTNSLGRAFVSIYYKVSPPVADFIRDANYRESKERESTRKREYTRMEKDREYSRIEKERACPVGVRPSLMDGRLYGEFSRIKENANLREWKAIMRAMVRNYLKPIVWFIRIEEGK